MVLADAADVHDDERPPRTSRSGRCSAAPTAGAPSPTPSTGPTRRSASSVSPHRADDDVGALNLHEQRFVELARALAGRPRLLLLDEVMAGLNDTELQASIDIVRTARDRFGVTVIWVEHVMKAVMSLAERVAVLNFGCCSPTASPAT